MKAINSNIEHLLINVNKLKINTVIETNGINKYLQIKNEILDIFINL